MSSELQLVEGNALARSGGASPLPVFNALQMTEALSAYQGLQRALDNAMPDQIMDLDGKKFRKKGYWRAVAVAFNLSVETLEERRELAGTFKDGRPNFGYVVSKRVTAPNGRSVVADGTCFAVEKARRFKCPHLKPGSDRYTIHFPHSSCPDFDPEFQWRTVPGDATEHNVRGHASTRAFNRAVSDLVGFGEVSAEEITREERDEAPARRQGTAAAPTPQTPGPAQQPTTSAAAGSTTVEQIQEKKGASAKGPWCRRSVTFGDGRIATTFSDSLTKTLEEARDARPKTLVNPEIVSTDKGNNLTGLAAVVLVVDQTHATEAAHPDEPVDGPEQVLTVRRVESANGPRWIIQTGKRQLVTDVEQHSVDAVAARDAKLGILPSFDIVPRAQGGMVNKLKSFLVEIPEPGAQG